ncbi:hypothetical protein EVB81_115 [Rhizobium phage RHph_I46]|uniref:Uncharacterized protein n=1 Tax=Rhizobium phage RHph_I1_9 TaxID=2509729 RepID=A0A7S5UYI1_9CAUD|nr:hypothetical protein PP936_gp114 [Rhizobium phage RHph_I1_9]QIG69684.1 hypothetical protein EVB81_115 [Rhizobium phage RHph_I46]QIG70965.1 hypothetical protein EVB92_115 [Rhizobium phage RHph_I9]QIG73551.1 hypothetical protein EVC04_114 [Rhizobium phage RHph_I1_9]QIG76304.1 hypothetical protein EVC25_115 [Rhizobium phage RHph_I34]
MTSQKQKLIAQEVVENEFFDSLEFREDYGGRGMYGDRTFGIVGQFDRLMTFLQVYGSALNDAEEEPVMDFRMDNMGIDMIIYPISPIRD